MAWLDTNIIRPIMNSFKAKLKSVHNMMKLPPIPTCNGAKIVASDINTWTNDHHIFREKICASNPNEGSKAGIGCKSSSK